MTICFRPIAAALFALSLFTLPAAAQSRETEQVDRTVPLQPGGSLRLKNFSGDIRITGTDTAEVTIHAVRRASRSRLDRIKLSIESSGSEVVINANDRPDSDDQDGDNVVDTTFEIRVPRQTNIEVTSFSSGITVSDVDGRHRVNNFSGDVHLSNVSGPLRAKTFSGDIELQVSGSEGADLRFSTFSGDIDTDLPLTFISKSRKQLHATLNGGGREVTVETFSGDVRINR
jgi:Putative adhesin